MILSFQIKQGRFGIIRICVCVPLSFGFLILDLRIFFIATQYCDGLRGPFVVYDPYDPYKHL
jgi:hypothetical protein